MMQLIGHLDSPHVRRIAITMLALGVPVEHRPISVMREIDLFRTINPVVKVPTLVADDGTAGWSSTSSTATSLSESSSILSATS